MKKIVSFIPKTKFIHDVIPSPSSAINFVPTWLKTIPKLPPPNQDSPKKCMPFMDTFTTGYIQELIVDVKFTYIGKDVEGADIFNYTYNEELKPLSSRKERRGANNLLPHFGGFYNAEFNWNSFWEPLTPPGYSTVYTHPLNRPDLPFYTFTGIIDTDIYPVHGPIPFILRQGFEGIIPAGTPIYQIFFIKRETWISNKQKFEENFIDKIRFKAKRFLESGYKNIFWNKKEYK